MEVRPAYIDVAIVEQLITELREFEEDYPSGGRYRSAFSDDGKLTLPGSSVPSTSRPWEEAPHLRTLRDKICSDLDTPLNFCLVNYYQNGNDKIKIPH